MKEKICQMINKVWAVLSFLVVFAGGLTVLGFALALIVGGHFGQVLSVFLYKKFFPVVIVMTSCLIVLGWLRMELKGEKALTSGKKSK